MSSSAVQAKKSDRVKFGVTGKPVVAKQVFMKAMEHDSQKSTKSWILVTPDNRVLRVNTYDGNAGKNFDPNGEGVSHEMPDQKTWNKKLKGYTEVAISECPIATAAETTPPTETSPSTNS